MENGETPEQMQAITKVPLNPCLSSLSFWLQSPSFLFPSPLRLPPEAHWTNSH